MPIYATSVIVVEAMRVLLNFEVVIVTVEAMRVLVEVARLTLEVVRFLISSGREMAA